MFSYSTENRQTVTIYSNCYLKSSLTISNKATTKKEYNMDMFFLDLWLTVPIFGTLIVSLTKADAILRLY